jgi:hypothetical protein
METRFASLGNPQTTGYVFVSSYPSDILFSYRNTFPAWSYALQYDTYGDGMTQHCPLYPVPIAGLADYCVSLASVALENTELAHAIAGCLITPPNRDIIDFLAGLRSSETKTRFFNPRERKTSTQHAKRYDTRWHEIPSWASGSASDVYSLMNMTVDHISDKLSQYLRYRDIYDQLRAHGKTPGGFCELDYDATYALETLELVAKSARARSQAEHLLKVYSHNRQIVAQATASASA